jgi:uncharacterized protein HemX
MKKTIILAGLILLGAPGAFAQERRLSCEETRDRALTRVTIVSNSRVLMEEDLAALSVSLRYARQGIARLERELAGLKKQLQEAQAASGETKGAEPEPKAGEAETEAPDPETKGPEGETPTAPSDVEAGAKEPTQ